MIKYLVYIQENNAPLPLYLADCRMLDNKVTYKLVFCSYNKSIGINSSTKFNNLASAKFYGSKVIEQNYTTSNTELDLSGTTAHYGIVKVKVNKNDETDIELIEKI